MRIRYYASAKADGLYGADFCLQGRYLTSGLHSFILDTCNLASRAGIQVDLIVEDSTLFPLANVFADGIRVFDLAEQGRIREPADAIVLDIVSDKLLDEVPDGTPRFCIVQSSRYKFAPRLIDFCQRFICMTEISIDVQSASIDPSKLVLIRQGVDLERFRPRAQPKSPPGEPRVLLYTRLNHAKRPIVLDVVGRLTDQGVDLTVLGSGDLFWEISDRFGAKALIVNHVPCHSIHRFLPGFDVVISSGRGAMEACASGIPTICAGLEYGGILRSDNVMKLLPGNLTGKLSDRSNESLADDLAEAATLDGGAFRSVAEEHFDGANFVRKLKRLIEETLNADPP